MPKNTTKPKNTYRMPGKLWKFLKKHLPKKQKVKKPGRPPVNNRDVLDGAGTTTWVYDATGQVKSVVDPEQHTVTYQYELGRLETVTDWNNQVTGYSYHVF